MDSSNESTARKVQLEELSKDELIKKCRSLLTIAQKAKQAKDALTDENDALREKLNSTEASLNAANEIVDDVTKQKLDLVSTIDALRMQHAVVEKEVAELDTENVSLRRQTHRLTDENEQLLAHLETMERKLQRLTDEGLQQQEQLLLLEAKNGELKGATSEVGEVSELQTMLSRSLEEVQNLQRRVTALTVERDEKEARWKRDVDELRRLQETLRAKEETLDETEAAMHKSRALNERLTDDIRNARDRLSENQIYASGMASDLENANIKLRDKLKNYHAKIVKLATDVKALKQTRFDLLARFKSYTDQVLEWKNALNALAERLDDSLAAHRSERQSLTDEIERLTSERRDSEARLEAELADLRALHEKDLELTAKSGEEIRKLVAENARLTATNDELEGARAQRARAKDACVQTAESRSNDDRQQEDLGEQLTALKREHHEVLNEMNEMNQALKERGETISQQQTYCDELLKKMQIIEAQLNKKCDALAEKDELVETLRKELDRLRDRLAETNEESDAMSTSTMSRADESNRFKELDGAWEERYGKLRTLALKLKAKIKSLTDECEGERGEKADAQHKLATHAKLVQTLQSDNDRLQDEVETARGEARAHAKKLDQIAVEISKDKKRLAANDEELAALRAQLEASARAQQDLDAWKKQVGAKVQTLKRELEANAVVRKEHEAEIERLKGELLEADRALRDERDKHKETRTNLVESNNECKKQTVINLEMQDYERSIRDLSQKLDMKRELVGKLRGQLDAQTQAARRLREENASLEERRCADVAALDAAARESHAYRAKIDELEAVLGERDAKATEMAHQLETVRLEKEDLATQLSTAVGDHQRAIDAVRGERERLRVAKIALEQELRELRDRHELKAAEVERLGEEYRAYKVRAQSVLRQNQTRDVGVEEGLKDEIETLKAGARAAAMEVDELRKSLADSKTTNERIVAEKQALIERHAAIKRELDELTAKHGQLQNKYQQAIADSAETIRGLKVHADTLSQCYRQQIADQELRHNREIVALQSKLEKGNQSAPDVPSLMLPSMQREEGEGSESVDSNYNVNHLVGHQQQQQQPIPLEKLLNIDNDHELTIVRRQLAENEAKVVHLTGLLADTEQDLAKHVQMNKLLKEEIRRQQRSVEREQHAENLEYLKNVVFKFVTLSGGDERMRLVPVLNTILKLSPDETSKLNAVARGDGKNWSNYLPTWSSKTQ